MTRIGERIDVQPPTLDGILRFAAWSRSSRSRADEEARAALDARDPRRPRCGACASSSQCAAREGAGDRRASSATRLDEIARLIRRGRGIAGAARRRRSAPGSPSRSRRFSTRRRRSIPTGSTRRPCCSPPRPTSARRSTGSTPMSWRPRDCFGRRRRRSAGGSISWRRNSTARSTRSAPSRTTAALTAIGLELKARGRSVPRADPESGVSGVAESADRAPRSDAGAVVALGRRQVDDRARLLHRGRDRPCAVDLGDDAAAPAERGRGRALPFHRSRSDSGACATRGDLLEWAEVHGNLYGTPRSPVEDGACRRAATCSSTSTGRARAQTRRGDAATTSSASSSCRRRWPSSAPGSSAAPRTAPTSSSAASPMPATRSATGANTTTSSSTRICRSRSTRSRTILRAERQKRVRQRGLADLVARLQSAE